MQYQHLYIDSERYKNPTRYPEVGITVIARLRGSDEKREVDIVYLDAPSLREFLSRNQDSKFAHNCLGIILGHGFLYPVTELRKKSYGTISDEAQESACTMAPMRGPYRISCILRPDEKTKNGRKYPYSILHDAVALFRQQIENRWELGGLASGDPMRYSQGVPLRCVAHRITNVFLMNYEFMVEIDPLDTPEGRRLRKYIQFHGTHSVLASPLGEGTVEAGIVTSYRIKTIDVEAREYFFGGSSMSETLNKMRGHKVGH